MSGTMCFHSKKSRLYLMLLLSCNIIPKPYAAFHVGDNKTEGGINNSSEIDHQHVDSDIVAETGKNEEGGKYISVTIDYFINALMWKYGNGELITFEGFEHLLNKLNLANILFLGHSVDCHRSNNSSEFISFHSNHNHSEDGHASSNVPAHCTNSTNTHLGHEGGHEHNNGHKHDHGSAEDTHESHDHESHDHEHDSHDHDSHNHEHGSHEHESHDHKHHSSESIEGHNDTHHLGKDGHKNGNDDKTDEKDNDHIHPEEEEQEEQEKKDLLSKKDMLSEDGFRSRRSDVHKSSCLPPKMMLSLVNSDKSKGLTKEMFTRLCPALIYQIDQDSCNIPQNDHEHSHDHDHDHDHPAAVQVSEMSIPGKVWGFSIVAVIIISLVGLLGVAVIPIVQKVFYNHLLQFLVALAVGALSGDAFLHLLPHAIGGGHSHEKGHEGHGNHGDGEASHSHDLAPIYKGLCGLLGIYFFFVTERILTIFTDIKRRKKKRKNRKRYNSNEDEDQERGGERLANSDMECDEVMMSIHPNKALKGYAEEAHSEHCSISFANTTAVSHEHGHRHHTSDKVYAGEDETIISQSSNDQGHGLGHGHSHCKDGVPKSVSAIAWMVILGDGIHNFSDGLAIGAAFANSITGGFSTSIAVFCHELPHEIGDFAMLLRAGMSAKQAIIYNCISSILCFIGMLIGVAIGNLHNASLWVFAIVAGMFLYIALVDMLPEMSSVDAKEGENPFFHLFLQLLGMMIGAGIMLVIALYEEDLKTVFD